MTLRGIGKKLEWSKTMRVGLEEAGGSSELAETFPMIEVPNPRAGEDGQRPTLLVFRTWTVEDVKKAVEGVISHRENPQDFHEQMMEVQRAYHLNGIECQQAWMTAMKADWAKVKGNWNPMNDDDPPRPLPHNSQELIQSLTLLGQRIREAFPMRPDYGKIGQTKQKDGELVSDFRVRFEEVFKANSGLRDDDNDDGAYRQQLKQALLQAMRPEIADWIRKHYIDLPTGALQQFMNFAVHAEKVMVNKKKVRNQSVDTFWQEESSDVFFGRNMNRGRNRGRGQGRGRGKGNFKGSFRGRFRESSNRGSEQVDDGCWICGQRDHWLRDCPERKKSD
ncbi:uncharacterized protein LOC111947772 [Oryzias latipes]|uniref:uncharacterized protein LOC111947772 n=1 Tax=Oryzias latipes TaxID=8090 RepID=UPI000CE167EA|nr:uncharacterized protein LOC111947772 [Oryzias latipes]